MTTRQILVCDKCTQDIEETVPHVVAYNKWHFHKDCFNHISALSFVKMTDQDYVFLNGGIFRDTPLTTWKDRYL